MVFEGLMKFTEKGNLTSFLLFILFIGISWTLSLNFIKWIKRRKTLPPGPIGLPWVGYLPFLGSEPHKTLWEMKEKYGDIIGLKLGSRFTVVLNEYSVAKEVITHLGALDRPPDLFNHIPLLGFGDANGEKWIEQRRFCLSVSRDLGLGRSSWEDLVMEEVHSFADEIQNSGGRPVIISETLAHSVTSNIISLLIGRKLNKKDEANKIQLSLDFADVAFTYMGPSDPATVMPGLRKLLEVSKISGYSRAAKIIKTFGKFIKEEVYRHKKSEDRDDFINSYLSKLKKLDSKESNTQHYFSEKMLEGNVTVLFLGASDTITSSLGWLFRLMADYKDIQDKVYKEIMDVIGKDGAVKYEERDKIPYTFAVLMESQRFSSIVPLSTTRKANQDIPIRDYIIPKGAEITMNLWGLHHDPKYWNEVDKFIPERFLSNDGTKLIKQPESFAPFSYGRRMCPGETVAWMEILSYFSHIVRNYEISFPPGVKPDYRIMTGLVQRLVPQPMCFKERS
ncbi:vitamin D 25-hydroxylase [Parasteatoda tepidariorum]|uniref:vitamin D 25-hydroxylase n=1 Tax=Parasteatoda tepidariorum TaxID=114398 RepID=UPI001C71A680|nr:vitamin D 25-hydroxylase [Parasteatoda tepidariorum]